MANVLTCGDAGGITKSGWKTFSAAMTHIETEILVDKDETVRLIGFAMAHPSPNYKIIIGKCVPSTGAATRPGSSLTTAPIST